MRSLTAADLLKPDALRAGQQPTPEWGADSCCYVAQLSALERDELEEAWGAYKQEHNEEGSNVGIRAFFVAYCLCNENNVRLFQDLESVLAAAASLKGKHSRPVARLFDLACEKNGLLRRDVEQLEKNSQPPAPQAPAAGSGSGASPSPSAEPAASSSPDSPAESTPSSKRSRTSSR